MCIRDRTYNDLELTDAAVRAGARAIVIKGHHCGTVSRAALCNAYNRAVHGDNSFYMYGGLVLNQEAGGLNEQAVQTALRMDAAVRVGARAIVIKGHHCKMCIRDSRGRGRHGQDRQNFCRYLQGLRDARAGIR